MTALSRRGYPSPLPPRGLDQLLVRFTITSLHAPLKSSGNRSEDDSGSAKLESPPSPTHRLQDSESGKHGTRHSRHYIPDPWNTYVYRTTESLSNLRFGIWGRGTGKEVLESKVFEFSLRCVGRQFGSASRQDIAVVCVQYGGPRRKGHTLETNTAEPAVHRRTTPRVLECFATRDIVGVMTGSSDIDPSVPYQDLLTLITTDLDLGTLASAESGVGNTATTVSGGDVFFPYEEGEKSLTCRIPGCLLPTDPTNAHPENVQFKVHRQSPVPQQQHQCREGYVKHLLGDLLPVPAPSIRKHTYLLPIEDSVPGQPYILQEGQGGTKRKFHLEDNLEVRFWAAHQEDDPKAEADGERESEGQVHKPYHTLTPYSGPYISGTVFEKGDAV
ncbi:hypothetical protein FA13DRAFT_1705809 [Coprinellus micaceus]|uniref:Uncharacterized protein n=1 Tax=Coprinellus micaceus TaxID=71717 RepID=A0A4Y7TVU6_COPMI|nr:hypothetical protein FA13DRAFT_1705809 [Coprinellus micaceus]